MLTVGVDVGTGSVHAVAFDPEHGVVGRGSSGYQVTTPRAGWAEQDPEHWWRATVSAIGAVLADVSGIVDAVAVSGQGAAVVLLDGQLRPLRPALIHLDQRATAEAAELASGDFAHALRRASGNSAGAWNAAAKLGWLRRHEPEAVRDARIVTSAAGFVLARLTGQLVQSASDAGISDLFDLGRRTWSAELRDLAGVPGELLPRIAEATDVVGTVCPDAAAATGLASSVRVRAGGEDTSSAALAAGVLDAGDAYLSLGTAGVVGVAVPAGTTDEPRLLSFPHVRAGLDLLSGSMTSAGAALRWWADVTGSEPADLLAEAEQAAESDVVFVPYLAGELHPINDPDARGAFAGLSLATDRAALTRSIVAGSAAAIAHNLEVAAESGTPAHRLLATGRPATSALWMQEVADATGLPVDVTADDGAAVGDAVIAACESDAELGAVARAHHRVSRSVAPRPDRLAAARANRARIAAVYQATKGNP